MLRVRLVPSNMLKPLVIFLMSVPRRCFFGIVIRELLFYLCFVLLLYEGCFKTSETGVIAL